MKYNFTKKQNDSKKRSSLTLCLQCAMLIVDSRIVLDKVTATFTTNEIKERCKQLFKIISEGESIKQAFAMTNRLKIK